MQAQAERKTYAKKSLGGLKGMERDILTSLPDGLPYAMIAERRYPTAN